MLTSHGQPTGGLVHALQSRLSSVATPNCEGFNSNKAFFSLAADGLSLLADMIEWETTSVRLEDQDRQSPQQLWLTEQLVDARVKCKTYRRLLFNNQLQLEALKPRLFFSTKLPASAVLSILGQLGK